MTQALASLKFSRQWAMPNPETLNVPVIRSFVSRYLFSSKVSVDPFARNCELATYRNDLDPETKAQYHLDVLDFLKQMLAEVKQADLVIFDPPYSLEQMKRSYNGKLAFSDTQRCGRWSAEKTLIARLVRPGGYCLSFGWDTTGIGKNRGFEIVEILLVCHGAGHQDTICMAEQRFTRGLTGFSEVST